MAAVAIAVMGVAISWMVYQTVTMDGRAAPTVPSIDLGEVLATPEPEPKPTGGGEAGDGVAAGQIEPEPADPPTPEIVPPPVPEPREQARPQPAKPAPAPAPTGMKGQLTQGWNLVGADPRRAASVFRQVLAQSPRHAEANYGLGYALLQQNDNAGAGPHLCAAMGGSDIEIRRDVTSLLSQYNLSCP